MNANDIEPRHLIILAGGEGRRMGGVDKSQCLFQGKQLYRYVIASAHDLVDNMVMVGDYYQDTCLDIERVIDLFPGEGPMSGLNTVSELPLQGTLLICGCDMPKLDQEAWLALLDKYDGSRPVFAATDDAPFHLVIVAHTCHLDALKSLFDLGERRIRSWLTLTEAMPVDFNARAYCLQNVNSPTQLEP